jgi:shikimate kinase
MSSPPSKAPARHLSVVGKPSAPAVRRRQLACPIVLVGLMGAGKTAVGRRLAAVLGVGFADADEAIVEAASMSIPDIFELYGEQAFRDVERRVIARLVDEEPAVLALGGGAFIDPRTREKLAGRAVTVWLKADLDTLVARTARKRTTRPLLREGDPRETLAELMARRYPIYALADHTLVTGDQPLEEVVERLEALLVEVGVLRDVA